MTVPPPPHARALLSPAHQPFHAHPHCFFVHYPAQAVQSLDETINEMFGDASDNNNDSGGNVGSSDTRDGWVELRGGAPAPASALLDPEAAKEAAAAAMATVGNSRHSRSGSSGMVTSAGVETGGYPGAFIMGSGAGRAGGAKGRGRVFGTPLEQLVFNPDR